MTAAECNSAMDRQQRHRIGGTGDIYQLYAQRTGGTQKALAAGLNPVMAALMGQVLENNRGNTGIVYYSAVTVWDSNQ
jgi:hypothetical protein